MYDKKMEEDARVVMSEHPHKRVLPFTYNNTSYFIKRCISNGRNRFAKQNAHMAYLTEVYKIRLVNSRVPLAPAIVLTGPDYFVMKASGRPLQRIVKEYPEDADEAYYKAGEALARLHSFGLHHGRPALRDIAWDHVTRAITFLDWENEMQFFHVDARVLDLFLFIHSYFREGWPGNHLLDQAMEGYQSVPGWEARLTGLRNFITGHGVVFGICRHLTKTGWIDVVSVSKAEAYIHGLS